MEIIHVGPISIGKNHPAFIVAEIGINHNGELDTAKNMVTAAKACNVDAVKFQTFDADEFISDRTRTYTYLSQGKTVTESMYDMFKRYEFSKKEWAEIIRFCGKENLIFFSSPQNASDLDFLMNLTNLPAIKVGSDDLVNLPLLTYYASKGLPLIISAGMANLAEIERAVDCIRDAGNNDIMVLHCVSSYPTEARDVNLRKMKTIEQAFQVIVGFSDHTIGSTASIAAIALGAKVVEKHFTLDKHMPGPDHWFSMDTKEMKCWVDSIKFTESALGSPVVKPTLKEKEIAAQNIGKGEVITKDMITFKRPGTGLQPMFLEYIMGRKSIKNIDKNAQITLSDIGQ
jgi:N,N'-diacetyllegionaminate synthase